LWSAAASWTDDFESIKLLLPTGLTLGCESIDYSDEKGDEVVTGTGSLPQVSGRGEYKGTCKLEVQRLEYDKPNLFSATSGGFYNMPPIPVIASYGNLGQPPVTDSMLAALSNSRSGISKARRAIRTLSCQSKALSLAVPVRLAAFPRLS
jgi:hypothetical protein